MRLGVRLRETSFSYLLLDIEALAAGLSDATLLQLIDFLLRQFPCLSHHQSLYQVNLSHPLDVGLGVVAGRTLRGNEASRLLARRGFSWKIRKLLGNPGFFLPISCRVDQRRQAPDLLLRFRLTHSYHFEAHFVRRQVYYGAMIMGAFGA